MYAPACHDEITGLVHYLDEQLAAIRAAATGLTDEQARMRPCASALSIGGLIKHATYVMQGGIERLAGGALRTELDESAFAAYQSSFAVAAADTVDGQIAAFDAARVAYLAAVGATDPAATTQEPPTPWYGIFDVRPAHARYLLVHHVEEFARHAGHADILREQIDGVSVAAIVVGESGMPASDFFQPYVPAPGTIGAR